MSHPNELLNELRIDRSAKQQAPEGRPWLWVAVATVALVAIVASYFFFGREEAIEVKTATATAVQGSGGGSASVLDASGYVTARRIATVSSKITGKVKEVFIEEGQRVEEGEVLARLDAADADAQRELAQSQLASAQSQLAEARAQLVLADRTLVRQRELAAKKLVAQSALDAAEADRTSRASRLQSLERAVKVARDGVEISALGVDNTVIRAPFTGVIVAKAAQPGEMISPISGGGGSIRTGIGTLVDMDSLEVQVDVNEAYIGRVQPKMPVEAVLNAYPDWKIPAEVIAIVPTADRSKATVKVRIALNQKDPRIVPDMGVRVSFLETTPASAPQVSAPRVQVPVTAVRKDGTQDIVFVMKDGKAERRAIKAGGTVGDQRQVLAGLNGGEQVIVEAPDTLKEGDEVRLAETK
ncbi:efflux RND transporter periplasmic adaptor subunit [Arenimonas sp.]|uniref:efflux RND transporter periplasmic adaptor subunit n=1 Tax=Arenimonas sp. TaxID=1872635 RepID=UPI0039E249EC